MNLVSITNYITGLEFFLNVILVIAIIGVIIFLAVADCKGKFEWLISIAVIIACICGVFFSTSIEDKLVYRYNITDMSQVQAMIENGYEIYDSGVSWYSFTKVE